MNVVERLEALRTLGAHERGIDRALLTPPERRARALFASWARASGLHVTQDGVSNLFARREGTRAHAHPILVGSHLDTVPTGGAYDGAYGVAAALCAIEVLDARGVRTAHPIEAVAWAGEEGSRFSLGCLGSSVFAGVEGTRPVLVEVQALTASSVIGAGWTAHAAKTSNQQARIMSAGSLGV